jgi:hypothetical protein
VRREPAGRRRRNHRHLHLGTGDTQQIALVAGRQSHFDHLCDAGAISCENVVLGSDNHITDTRRGSRPRCNGGGIGKLDCRIRSTDACRDARAHFDSADWNRNTDVEAIGDAVGRKRGHRFGRHRQVELIGEENADISNNIRRARVTHNVAIRQRPAIEMIERDALIVRTKVEPLAANRQRAVGIHRSQRAARARETRDRCRIFDHRNSRGGGHERKGRKLMGHQAGDVKRVFEPFGLRLDASHQDERGVLRHNHILVQPRQEL